MASKEKLIEDLQTFSNKLGETATAAEMRNSGPWSPTTYKNHFGSWNEALEAAGLDKNNENNIDKERLIADLKKFTEKLDKTPTAKEMSNCGPHSSTTYKNHFDSWNKALEAACVEKNHNVGSGRLIEDLQTFANKLDKTPTQKEMNNRGPWDSKTYKNHFGSWNEALEAAGLEINRLSHYERAGTGEYCYGSGWKKARRKTLKRDNKCQACGESEKLHVHHIKPRREFDDVSESNTLDNLVTLCISCHTRFEGRWKKCSPDEFARRAKDITVERN